MKVVPKSVYDLLCFVHEPDMTAITSSVLTWEIRRPSHCLGRLGTPCLRIKQMMRWTRSR